jgi:hypothetical protein
LVVLVEEATEHFPPLDRQVQRNADLAVSAGRSLLAGLVRAVPLVVDGVLAQDRLQVWTIALFPRGFDQVIPQVLAS